jgi:hypothetical protein
VPGRSMTSRPPGKGCTCEALKYSSSRRDDSVAAYATPCFVVTARRAALQMIKRRSEGTSGSYWPQPRSGSPRRQNWKCTPPGHDAAVITVRWIAHWLDQSPIWDFPDSNLGSNRGRLLQNSRRRCAGELALQILDRAHLIRE